MRTRPGAVEPEVWFRIVPVAQVGHPGAPVAPYCEQTVEIALGPKGAFENGNIVELTRKVPLDGGMNTFPHRRENHKSPRGSKIPRVTVLLRKAIEWQRQLDVGEVPNKTEIARREGITRARVTQVMALLRLTPEFQEQILSMSDMIRKSAITERQLRTIINKTEWAPIAS